MNTNTPHPDPSSEPDDWFDGDPGAGALVADPLAPSGPHDNPDPEEGPASPDPAQPTHHGEWSPTKRSDDRPST